MGFIGNSLDDQRKSRQFPIHTEKERLTIRVLPILIEIRKSLVKPTIRVQSDGGHILAKLVQIKLCQIVYDRLLGDGCFAQFNVQQGHLPNRYWNESIIILRMDSCVAVLPQIASPIGARTPQYAP